MTSIRWNAATCHVITSPRLHSTHLVDARVSTGCSIMTPLGRPRLEVRDSVAHEFAEFVKGRTAAERPIALERVRASACRARRMISAVGQRASELRQSDILGLLRSGLPSGRSRRGAAAFVAPTSLRPVVAHRRLGGPRPGGSARGSGSGRRGSNRRRGVRTAEAAASGSNGAAPPTTLRRRAATVSAAARIGSSSVWTYRINIVTGLCAVSAMPTFTGTPELAMSVAARCRTAWVPQ